MRILTSLPVDVADRRPTKLRFLAKLLGTVAAIALVQAGSFATLAHAQDGLESGLVGGLDPNAELALESDNLTYDFDRDLIIATGDVQVFYDGATVEAHKIVFDRKNGQLSAYGNVILTEPDGNVIRTEEITLSEDLANGFARALRVETADRTRITADSAERANGNTTTFQNGTYSVYTGPKNPPEKPPLWRIKSSTIIHDKQSKTITYEDARFEFFGVPIAYFPYMSMPDPSVKRKSGFLIPNYVLSSKLGIGVSAPYYWALNPHYDLTTTITPLTRQGVLGDATFRHRLRSGEYTISAAGISQANQSEFSGTSGDKQIRGAVRTTGSFNLTDKWTYGWDLIHKTDRAFLADYSFTSLGGAERSNIYLDGYTDRNSLTFQGYAFSISQEDYRNTALDAGKGFSPVGQQLQDKQAFVLPVIDYDYVFSDPIVDGELSLKANFTSLTRAETDAFSPDGGTTTRFRGVDGTFSRLSGEAEWRRTFIDPLGQTFTPFAYVRGDLFWQASSDNDVDQLTEEDFAGRAMPAAGIEYRYPIVATFNGGNQIIEPIAQVIVRPDEQRIGQLPNEDAQSLVFDATTLFEYDKFSGFDRAEGGSRLNLGLSYKLQLDGGHYLSALFGRSIQLSGDNSFAKADILGAASDSGLESRESDYVGSLYLDTRYGVKVGTQARFDDEDFSVNRLQAQALATYGPVVSSLTYAFLNKKPSLGITDPREEIVGSASLKLLENWRLYGSFRYDLENENFVQDGLGVGYDDEGFSMSLSYLEDRSRNDGEATNKTIYFRIGLRTIGDFQLSQGLGQQ